MRMTVALFCRHAPEVFMRVSFAVFILSFCFEGLKLPVVNVEAVKRFFAESNVSLGANSKLFRLLCSSRRVSYLNCTSVEARTFEGMHYSTRNLSNHCCNCQNVYVIITN